MPLTTLDPRTALVVIDLQQRIVESGVPGIDEVVTHSAELVRAFRVHGLPVVLVNVTGRAQGRSDADQTMPRPAAGSADDAALVPELEAAPEDVLITKERWGAFTGTDLHDRLSALGVTQIVLTGVATSIGVESTARSAHELGYHVTLATDAMADRDPVSHAHSLERIFPRLGETGTTAEVIALLGNR